MCVSLFRAHYPRRVLSGARSCVAGDARLLHSSVSFCPSCVPVSRLSWVHAVELHDLIRVLCCSASSSLSSHFTESTSSFAFAESMLESSLQVTQHPKFNECRAKTDAIGGLYRSVWLNDLICMKACDGGFSILSSLHVPAIKPDFFIFWGG